MKKIIRIFVAGVLSIFLVAIIVDIEQGRLSNFISYEGTSQLLFETFYGNRQFNLFIIFFILMYFSSSKPLSEKLSLQIENKVLQHSFQEILIYLSGFSIGLWLSNIIGNIFVTGHYGDIEYILRGLILMLGGYLGVYLTASKKVEIKNFLRKRSDENNDEPNETGHGKPKILDTSVIIDGRILDILKTNFIEDKIIIPSCVLDELRHIADSSDKLKRNRGRMGLDVLQSIQQLEQMQVEVVNVDFPEIPEVDSKLIKLAKELNGRIITNDFNLNKVAVVQDVIVLNINDLSNAVKPIALPKEQMRVEIVKEGKEQQQGIAYLNDGTMIVIENGKKHVGQERLVEVTTILQTSAGRMIFAKIIKEKGV